MIQFLKDIEEHFEHWYPREGCGILGICKGKLKWVPCDNVAESEEDFIIDSAQYIKAIRSMDVVAIVHSHPDADCNPSIPDISNCNATGIPYYIFSYPGMEMYTLLPENYSDKPLIGREYRFGTSDCYELAKDYYRGIGITIPNRALYEDTWWERGLDYFTEEYINTFGFKKVETVEKNDLLVFSVQSDIPNHCGVYLGDNVFLHHAEHRLSCRDNIGNLWLKALTGVYRYEA